MALAWNTARAVWGMALLGALGCGGGEGGGPADDERRDAASEGSAGMHASPGAADAAMPGATTDAALPAGGGGRGGADAAIDGGRDLSGHAGSDGAGQGGSDGSVQALDGGMTVEPMLGSGTIGADGGAVALPNGAYVRIPAGALGADVEITVSVFDDTPDLPDGLEARGAAYVFEPHGLHFAEPVTIVLPYDGVAIDVAPLKLADENDLSWSVVKDSVPVGGVLAFTTTSFSIYMPVGPEDYGLVDLCNGEVANLAEYLVPGQELIVDLDVHAANTDSNPLGAALLQSFIASLQGLPWIENEPGCSGAACFDQDALESMVLLGSDTQYAVLGGVSYSLAADGTDSGTTSVLSTTDLFGIVSALDATYPGRLLRTAAVMPNDRIDVQLSMMEARAADVVAWHTTTSWSPTANGGYFLDDMVGEQMIEQGIALGVPVFLVEKGTPRNGFSATYSDPRDVGPSAAAYPEARFVILHAAFEHGFATGENSRPDGSMDFGWGAGVGHYPEGPYDAVDIDVQALYPLDRGVNSLIKSLLDAGIGPNENVYVGLGSVFAELITRPTEAAHVLGKLLLYVGEDNILWGTESLWYGGPTPQIEAFRDFEIPEAMRTQYGYPELTPVRKAKILGVNAARLFCLTP